MKKTIVIMLMLTIVISGCSLLKSGAGTKTLSLEEAKTKTQEFINKNFMNPGSTVTVKESGEEFGLYKMVVDFGNGQILTSYLTKDGTKFFPQVMDVAEVEKQTQAKNAPDNTVADKQVDEAAKSDKPKVELFVMSHCPYGTQIEKGILPALETLGNAINFELKFCDYAMHGEKEIDEELNQYCIQKNEPTKLLSYLKCFLEIDDAGQSAKCVQSAGINKSKLSQCVAATDSQFKVKQSFNDKTTWLKGIYPIFPVFQSEVDAYGVQGSPTLVINGVTAGGTSCNLNTDCYPGETCVQTQAGKECLMQRDSESIKLAICSRFKSQPQTCATQLSSVSPSAGFGFTAGSSGSSGQCN